MNESLKDARKAAKTWGKLNPFRLNILRQEAKGRVLDIGCSSQDYVEWMLAHDIDATGCDLLEPECWTLGADRFVKADALALPFPDKTFDVSTMFEVLEHISDPEKALLEAVRVSKKAILITVPNCEPQKDLQAAGLTFNHYTDQTHMNFFTESTLSNILRQSGIQIKYIKKDNPVLSYVPFLSAMGIPISIAARLGRLLQPLTLRSYPMTLTAVGLINSEG